MKEILDPREEFKNFYILLQRDSWFSTVSSTHQLARILDTINRSDSKWDYALSKLLFKNISLDRHVRPEAISNLSAEQVGESKLLFDIHCECECEQPSNIIKDPILNLGSKVVIQFEYIDESLDEVKVLQCSWHLDKHDPTRQTSTTHPLYHYEYGGTELTKRKEFNYGDFILLDSPRLMHPPLDLVLSIDFIIKNFYNYKEHKPLTESSQYKRYIKNAQIRLWRPYAISFASHFHDFSNDYKIDDEYASNILHCPNNFKEA